jgi:hypothetical protein
MMIETINVTAAMTTPKSKRAPTPAQARAFGQGIINLVLMIWTIWDIRHRSDEEINGKRKLWMMAAFAPPIGPIAYFIFGRKRGVQKDSPPSGADSAQQTDVTLL